MSKKSAVQEKPAETTDEIFMLWMSSFEDFAKDHIKIQNMAGELVPFLLNPMQKVRNEIREWTLAQGRLCRFVIDKARREGLTTEDVMNKFWKVTTRPNRYAFMVTHEPEATDFVFNMSKRALNNLDPSVRPLVKYNSKKILEFNDPNGSPFGLDSAIRVGTAGKENLGSSQLIHYLLCDEAAKWPDITAEALLTSLFQCVPDEPDTEISVISTANGVGGRFYDMYWASRIKINVYLDENGGIAWKPEIDLKAQESNIWTSIFFPWFVFPEYAMAVEKWQSEAGKEFKRDAEEEKLVELYFKGIPQAIVNQKLCWRRMAIENKCQGSKKIFQQEYPANADESFLGTGRVAFDPYQVHALMQVAPKPVATYEILPHSGDFIAKQDGLGRLWVWKEPVPGRSYIMGGDTAEGIEISNVGGDVKYDFSCCHIVDQLTGQLCAEWHGHIDPDLWGRTMFWLGRRYNMAYAGPENNPGGHGATAINTMIQMGYTNIHVDLIPDPPGKARKRYGWYASSASIGQAVDNLKKEMRDGSHGITSTRTFMEMLSYKIDAKGKYGAEHGRHDDLVRSMVITKWLRLVAPPPDYSNAAPPDPYMSGPAMARASGVPDLSGYM